MPTMQLMAWNMEIAWWYYIFLETLPSKSVPKCLCAAIVVPIFQMAQQWDLVLTKYILCIRWLHSTSEKFDSLVRGKIAMNTLFEYIHVYNWEHAVQEHIFFHVRWLLRCSSLYLQLIGRVCGTLFSWCWWSLLWIDSRLPTEEGPLGSHLPMQLSPLFWEPGDLPQSLMFCFSETLPHDSQCMGDFTFIVLERLNLKLKGHPSCQPPATSSHPPAHTLAFISSLVSSICRCRSCRSCCSRIIPAWEK